jgi:predicted DNA-binding transcriptional regulator AlpA
MNGDRKKLSVPPADADNGGVGATVLRKDGYLRLPDVLSLIPVSKTTWWAGVKAGRYPAGVKLWSRVTAWRVADLAPLLQNGLPRE